MSKRQFLLALFVVATTIPLLVWGCSYSAEQSREAEVQKAQIEADAKADREQKKLERTKERWDGARRLFHKKAEVQDE